MLKGFIVIFTGLISYLLFKRKFSQFQVLGIISVVIGLLLVGLSNVSTYNARCNTNLTLVAPNPLIGNLLVICGQFFLAGMFVYEEKILKEYDVRGGF
jgi:drug/metabolite transporter (DMT)-like permease